MTERRDWTHLDHLLDGALDQPPERRRAWLAEACAGDEGLCSRALSLLALAEKDDGTLAPGGALRGPVWDEIAGDLQPRGDDELPAGTRVGPYEVLEPIGAGGMGRVYRARNAEKGRDVALKALPGELAADPSILRRFEREAKLLARLSHESIASLLELRVVGGQPILVLELAEGETLAEILARRALDPADAIAVARQVAAALEEAHGKGVIHRDLKPSNVKLSPEGRVKVLDFGLARRLPRLGQDPASTTGTLTQEGTVLGTIPYMSPEQARGDRVDERSDVWALGCLVYEMLTGRRAVASRSPAELLESLRTDDVDLSALPPGTPPPLRAFIRRCLRADPERRYQDVRDVRLDLEEISIGSHASEAARLSPAFGPRRSSALPWAVAALAVAGALTTAFLSRGGGGPTSGEQIRRFVLDLPPGVSLPREETASPVALSPDGSTVVLTGEDDDATRLYLRRLRQLAWTVLPGTEGARQPFLSPEGDAVGFFAGRHLMRAVLDGEGPVPVATVEGAPEGAAWTPDGTMVVGSSSPSGLVQVSARGGTPVPLTELAEGEASHRWPEVLPDGRTVLFTVEYRGSTFDDGAIEAVSLETGNRYRLLREGAHARLAPGGHLVYVRGGSLFTVPFDVDRVRVAGVPERALDGVAYDRHQGAAKMALAGDGTLAYVPAGLPAEAPRLILAEGWAQGLLRRHGP